MMVSVVMSAWWQRVRSPSLPGSAGLLGMGWPSGRVKVKVGGVWGWGDQVAEGVDDDVVGLAQEDQVAQPGLAAAGPGDDVVDVGAAGVAAGVLAAVLVAFADGAAQGGGGAAVPPAGVEQGAVVVVQHPGHGGVAGDGAGGGGADGGAVVEVAAPRVRGVPGWPGVGAGGRGGLAVVRRFRGNAAVVGRGGVIGPRFRGDFGWRVLEGFGADVHDHVVDVRVAGGGDLPGQVRRGHFHQRVGQAGPAGAVAGTGRGAAVRAGRGVTGGCSRGGLAGR